MWYPAGSISGDTLGISALPHDIFRPLQSVAPSGPWLFPDIDVFGDEVRHARIGNLRMVYARGPEI